MADERVTAVAEWSIEWEPDFSQPEEMIVVEAEWSQMIAAVRSVRDAAAELLRERGIAAEVEARWEQAVQGRVALFKATVTSRWLGAESIGLNDLALNALDPGNLRLGHPAIRMLVERA